MSFYHVRERNGRFADGKAVNRTVSFLNDGPERGTSVFAHWASVCFSSSIFLSGDNRTQRFSTHSAQTQVQLVGMNTVRNRWKKVIVCAELITEVCQLPSVKRKKVEDRAPIPAERHREGEFPLKGHVLQGLAVAYMTSMMTTNQERNHTSRFLHEVSGRATCDQECQRQHSDPATQEQHCFLHQALPTNR